MTPEQQSADRQARLRGFLTEQWNLFAEHADRYQWPRETDRWKEFVFCALHWAGQPALSAATARRLTQALDELGLVTIDSLGVEADPERAPMDRYLLEQLLGRVGVSPKRAHAVITVLCQVACALRRNHAGKMQRCLRAAGQRMLDGLVEEYGLAEPSLEGSRTILTHWLQNVCNMPLPLRDEKMLTCCMQMDVSPEEVLAAADDLDLNTALVDDMFACIPGAAPEAVAARKDG